MKKFKKFLLSKGGILVLLGTLGLILLATFLIIIGFVYTTYGGDWGKLGAFFKSDFAISIYVISGVIALLLFYISFILNRNKDIK